MAALRTLVQTSLAAFALVACDGNGNPAGPNGDDEDTYTGTWTIGVTDVATGATVTITCPGSVRIVNENASTFSGSYQVSSTENCDSGSGTFQGTISGNGITLVLNPDPFDDLELEGCTIVTQDDDFSGDLGGSSISFEGSLTTDCEGDLGTARLRWTVSFDGDQ